MRRPLALAGALALLFAIAFTAPGNAARVPHAKLSPDLATVVGKGTYGTYPIESVVPNYQPGTVYYLVDHTGHLDGDLLDSLQEAGAVVRFTFPEIHALAVVSPISSVERVAALDRITRLTLDRIQRVLRANVGLTTNPLFAEQSKRGTHDVGADALWGAGVTGAGVEVGVVDSGVYAQHPDLSATLPDGSAKLKGFVNCMTVLPNVFVDDPVLHGEDIGQCVSQPAYDDNGHGTHVSGIAVGAGVAETSNGQRLYPGMAPDAALVGAKVCNAAGSCLISSVMAGFKALAVDRPDGLGADIINVSLGGGRFYFSPVFGAEQETNGFSDENALVNSLSATYNVLFTISAGNSGPTLQSVASPGLASQALGVGAAVADFDLNHPVEETAHGELGNVRPEAAAAGATAIAQFSSRGPSGDRLIKPDVTAPGVYVISAQSPTGAEINAGDIAHNHRFSADQNYAVLSGTSMSAPSAAGTAALVWSGYEAATGTDPAYYRLKAALANTAGTRAFEGSVIGLISGIKAKDLGMDPAELFPLRNDGSESYVGTTGEGAGRVSAPAALLALTKGVIAYTPEGPGIRSLQPSWSIDDLAGGDRARTTFLLHGGPRLAQAVPVTFGVKSEAEPVGVRSAPSTWFRIPDRASVAPNADTPVAFRLKVPGSAKPGMYEATITGKAQVAKDVTEKLRIPVQFFVTLGGGAPAGALSTKGPIWASDTTDYSAVGFENPLGDIFTDWTMIPVRVPEGTKTVDLSVYDRGGNDHMDVFAFTSYGEEIDSTVSFFLDHAVPGGALYSPTTKDDPATVTLFNGDDWTPPCGDGEEPEKDLCITVPTTIWLAVSDSGPAAPPGFSTYHLDVTVKD